MLDSGIQTRLADFLKSNRKLIVFPGDHTSVKDLNIFFSQLCRHDILLEMKSAQGPENFFPMDREYLSPLLDIGNTNTAFNPDPVKVFKYFRLHNSGASLLRLSNGDALLARYLPTFSKGFLFVFGTMPGESWNDISQQAFFIPFLYQVLSLASSGENSRALACIDENYSMILPFGSGNGPFLVELNGAPLNEITPRQSSQGLLFDFGLLPQPGHYLLKDGKNIISAFSANISPGELQPPFIDFNTYLPGAVLLGFNDDPLPQIAGARTGYELWMWFLIMAIIMALAELLVVRLIEGKPNT